MKTIKFIAAMCLTIAIGIAKAQTTSSHTIGINIPAVAKVGIEPSASKNIEMDFSAPTTAGGPITAAEANNSLWLNYSYIPSVGKTTATIKAKVDSEITGVAITVTPGDDATKGGGEPGAKVAGPITLTATDKNIITGIKASYTGDGSTFGHNLSYAVNITSYKDLIEKTSNTITVTYTISQD